VTIASCFECLVRLGWLGGPPVGWRRRCHRLMTQRGWAVGAFEPSDYCLGLTAIRCRPRSRTVSPSLPPFLGPRSSLCLTHRYDSFGRLRSAWQNSIRPQTRGATWPAAPAFDVYVHLIIACSTPSNACSIALQRQRVLARASVDSGAITASRKSSDRGRNGKVSCGSTSAGKFVYPSQLTVSAIIFTEGSWMQASRRRGRR
jgi:hypothetical protein